MYIHFAGLIIGLSVASAPTLLLLVLGIIFLLRKIKRRRVKVLKQKYFKQNRGQLLQQMVSQKADIAERMIIPVDELAKATNNFDRARELGGGGHGTVYKGILSDLHVVAIKKSKITVQKEIDEFINEVAILSQIRSSLPPAVMMKSRGPKRSSAPGAHPSAWLATRSLVERDAQRPLPGAPTVGVPNHWLVNLLCTSQERMVIQE